MELRIFIEPQQGADYDTQLRVAKAAEELGFGAFFRSDHYLAMGSGDGLPGPTDSWVTLAGLARETRTIRLGTLVSAATFRWPGPLAIQVAQVDRMSGGRVEFGLGSGWFAAEHAAYGVPFPADPLARLEEQLAVITGLWRTPVGEKFDFAGAFYQLADSPALPKPLQDPVPVIIGGQGTKRTPRLAARYASEFNTPFTSFADSRAQYQRVRRAARARGRTDDVVFSASLVACAGASDAEVSRRAAAIGRRVAELRDNGLAGSPAEIVDKIGRYADIGAQRVYLQILDLSDLDHLQLIAERVLPHVKGLPAGSPD